MAQPPSIEMVQPVQLVQRTKAGEVRCHLIGQHAKSYHTHRALYSAASLPLVSWLWRLLLLKGHSQGHRIERTEFRVNKKEENYTTDLMMMN